MTKHSQIIESPPTKGASKTKSILLTGASSGFGLLAVPLLLERGHTVIAGVRGGEVRMRKIFSKEISRYPNQLIACDLHMDEPSTFTRALDLVNFRLGGKLDVLINNAGLGLFGAVEDQDDPQLRHEFEVNFFGPLGLTRSLLGALRAAQGRILNVSSIAGRFTFPFYGSYSASKFALEAISEGMHYELKPLGVQVGLVEPGAFKTAFNKAKILAVRSGEKESLYRQRMARFEKFTASSNKRQDDPAKVAKLIVSLCEKRHIPIRSLIGRDAWLITIFARVIPDSWRVSLTSFAFRKVIFKD